MRSEEPKRPADRNSDLAFVNLQIALHIRPLTCKAKITYWMNSMLYNNHNFYKGIHSWTRLAAEM